MSANLYTLFEDHFEAQASAPCVLIPGGPVVHCDELAALSARIAHALVRAGCRPGDRVAALVDKHWHALALYLACLRAGLVYLPLNVGYQRAELAYFFADATPRVIVCRPESLGLVTTLARTAVILTLDAHDGELLDRAAETPEIFETVRSFVDRSGLLEVQITVQTPFPGTPLYERLRGEGRLLEERFWDRCTLFDVNYVPKRMSVRDLESGLAWLMRETYSAQATSSMDAMK